MKTLKMLCWESIYGKEILEERLKEIKNVQNDVLLEIITKSIS